MGHWLGLLLSQTGSKTDPEELTYDYVNAERITSIVNAAKTSLYLMQRRYSEPNAYIDALPSAPQNQEELYDDVASLADPEDAVDARPPQGQETIGNFEEKSTQDQRDPLATDADLENRVYLDLVPVRSFLHTVSGGKDSQTQGSTDASEEPSSPIKEIGSTDPPEPTPVLNSPAKAEPESPPTPTQSRPQTPPNVKTPPQSQEPAKRTFSSSGVHKGVALQTSVGFSISGQTPRPKAYSTGCPGAVEGKLGKNRTEADLRRYIDERDRLEKEREEVRSSLAGLKKERRETKEELNACQDPKQQASLEARLKQMEEASREAERRRVEVELLLVEVKENLKKVEAGPFTLGTTLDCNLQDAAKTASTLNAQTSSPPPSSSSTSTSQAPGNPTGVDAGSPVNSASALKNRPASIMATKGKVLQKAKEWERKSTT